MKNGFILAGAAALAFTAPVLAQPGKGGGGGNGNKGGGGAPAQVQGGGGGGGKQARGGGPQQQQARGGGGLQMRGNGGGGGPKQQMRSGGGQQREARGGGRQQQVRGGEQRQVRVERQQQARGPVREARQERPDRGPARIQNGGGNQRVVQDRGRVQQQRGAPVDQRYVQRQDRVDGNFFRTDRGYDYVASPAFRTTGLVDGCPPGLAAKGNGCLPPGQAKKLVGAVFPVALGSALLPTYYRNWYPDNDDYYYRTSNDYVYRIDRDRNYVDAYWPLADDWNGAYYVGSAYPQDYLGYYNVPVQYQPWYADNGDDYYRYADGAIYQVDRQGGVIESIVSLLAGGFGVGQPMPAGYDVYNVPYQYRDRYVDNDEHLYRYNDGYIYDVDPTTQIVQAIVETLV